MKNSEVVVGSRYQCKVSGRIVPVTVIAQTHKTLIGGKTRIAFMVRNEVTGRVVTKSAAALRSVPAAALPPKDMQRTMLAIGECAFEDGERAAHFGNPNEKTAVRMMARAGYFVITQDGRDEIYAKLTSEGKARLATLRGETL